jgi:hypothetical protein
LKRFLKISALLIFALLLSLGYLLRFPQHWFRSEWVEQQLRKQSFARDWKWSEFRVGVSSEAWLEYDLSLRWLDLDLSTRLPGLELDSKLEKIDFKSRLSLGFSGLQHQAKTPLRVRSSELSLRLRPKAETLPKILEAIYWKDKLDFAWASYVPDFDVEIDQIHFADASPLPFVVTARDLKIERRGEVLKLNTRAKLPTVDGLPELPIQLELGREKLELSSRFETWGSFSIAQCRVVLTELENAREPSPLAISCQMQARAALISPKNLVSAPFKLEATGRLGPRADQPQLTGLEAALSSKSEAWTLQAQFSLAREIFEIGGDTKALLRALLPGFRAQLSVSDFQRFLQLLPEGYRQAPAPLTPMNGTLELDVKSDGSDSPRTQAKLSLDLKGVKQRVHFDANFTSAWDWSGAKPALRKPRVDLDLHALRLVLPRLAANEPLPPLIEDSRIGRNSDRNKDSLTRQRKPLEWTLDVVTDEPVTLKTPLVPQDIRLALQMKLGPPGPVGGHVSLLPMKLEVFRRPIEVEHFKVSWPEPARGVLDGRVIFRLPEYTIVLKVEGPTSRPRTAFESSPPLSQDDIYAVLLFGRPMAQLDPEGKQGMARVKQGLAQGFFSLSTLYLLGGSRIESLGFDPDSGDVTASVRLDSKHSMRVGTQDGAGTVALRRALGGGWFLESQAQEQGAQDTNFGLMLQRVLAY